MGSALQLEKAGHRCTSIRGDLDHQLRDRVVNEFRTGITKILIATDVLSRGFDVTQVLLATSLHFGVKGAKDCILWNLCSIHPCLRFV